MTEAEKAYQYFVIAVPENEERPGACVGCGYENSCSTRGCAVLRKVSRIVAREGERR